METNHSDPNAKEALKVLSRRGIKAEAVTGSPASGAALKAARLDRADTALVWGSGASQAGSDAQASGAARGRGGSRAEDRRGAGMLCRTRALRCLLKPRAAVGGAA
jgi:hypothetical protein